MKSSVENQSINLKKVEIGSKSVKSSQIDLTNVEEIVDSILSQRLSGFATRVDKIAENHKNISIINNDLLLLKTNLNELISKDLILLKTNLNELDEDIKEMAIERTI
ncbi:unnamed protein product [Brachionus calyciflorus]|uniref:Uncharacterized protein n=1 Tax=Brachionus calyciflorus TaxID=104777 RepID=A0A813UWC0_9BILA|nr:unnamed protein product [Brachionus calyciflorus]